MSKLILSMLIAVVFASSALAGDLFPRFKGVAPVNNAKYESECGSCHFAYQPGLLPSRSWRKLMEPGELEDHFGDNAEMEEGERLAILDFLVKHAAETSWYKRSTKINRSVRRDERPLRITETRYIKRKHEDIQRKMIQDNPKVRSLSYCNNCHMRAADGVYDDDTVRIPGFPDW